MRKTKNQIELKKKIKKLEDSSVDVMQFNKDETFDLLTKHLDFIPVSFEHKDEQSIDKKNIYFHPCGLFIEIDYFNYKGKTKINSGNVYISGYETGSIGNNILLNKTVDRYGNALLSGVVTFNMYSKNYLNIIKNLNKGCYILPHLPEMYNINNFFGFFNTDLEKTNVMITRVYQNSPLFWDNKDNILYPKILEKIDKKDFNFSDLIKNKKDALKDENYFLLSNEFKSGWLGDLYEESSEYKQQKGQNNILNQKFFKGKDLEFVNQCGEMALGKRHFKDFENNLLTHEILENTNVLHYTSKSKYYFNQSLKRIREQHGDVVLKEMLFKSQLLVGDGTPIQKFFNRMNKVNNFSKEEMNSALDSFDILVDLLNKEDMYRTLVDGSLKDNKYSTEKPLFSAFTKAINQISNKEIVDYLMLGIVEKFNEKDLNKWLEYNDNERLQSNHLSKTTLSYLSNELIIRKAEKLKRSIPEKSKERKRARKVIL